MLPQLLIPTAVAVALLTCDVSAQAIFRCVEPGGRVTYSDGACPANAARRQVGISAREEARSANYLDSREEALRQVEALRRPERAQVDEGDRWSIREKAERERLNRFLSAGDLERNWKPRYKPNGEIVGTPAPRQTEPQASPERSVAISSCNTSGCWGEDGSHYRHVGGGEFLTSDGFCRRVGNQMQCR